MEKIAYSRTAIKKTLSINTGEVGKLIPQLSLISNLLYGSDVIARKTLTDEEFDKIQLKVQSTIKNLEDYAVKKLEATSKELTDNGLEKSKIEFSNPVSIEFLVSTPTFSDMLRVFKKYDDLVANYELLWLSGIVTNDQRFSLVGSIVSVLRNNMGALINVGNQSKKLALARQKTEQNQEQTKAAA